MVGDILPSIPSEIFVRLLNVKFSFELGAG
jgi:hypothetical protein